MTAHGRGPALALLALLACAAPALADRKPTATEEAAIERVAVAACAAPLGDCTFRGARVSTADARFAWGKIIGEGISGVFYDENVAPTVISDIAQALPLKHLIDGLQGSIVSGEGAGHHMVAIVVLAAWAVAGLTLAVRGFSWESRSA